MKYISIKNNPGLYKQINKNGKEIFYCRVFHSSLYRGTYKNLTKYFGATTLIQASDAKKKMMAMLNNGEDPFALHKSRMLTLDDYFEDYMEDITNKSQGTQQGKRWYYNKHLKHLGKKAPSQITEKQLLAILNGTLKDKEWRTILELKMILNVIFKKAQAKGTFDMTKSPLLEKEVMDIMKNLSEEESTPIADRITLDLESFAKLIYAEVLDYKLDKKQKKYLNHFEAKIALTIGLMCARRRKEILHYRYEHIVDGRIYVPKEITKTGKRNESFPMPPEALALINELKVIKSEEGGEEGAIFSNVEEHMVTLHFAKIIDKINERNKCIAPNEKFTFHNCRHLFATIMAKYKSEYTVDFCISHSPPKMMGAYSKPDYETRAEVFRSYWKILKPKSTTRLFQ